MRARIANLPQQTRGPYSIAGDFVAGLVADECWDIRSYNVAPPFRDTAGAIGHARTRLTRELVNLAREGARVLQRSFRNIE